MMVSYDPMAREAITTFRTLERFEAGPRDEGYTLLECHLFTGRTHQIRATLCSLGYPVAGDKLYGVDELLFLKQKTEDFTPAELEKLMLKRQALHSTALSLRHPASGEVLNFTDPLPPELADFAEQNIPQGENYHG